MEEKDIKKGFSSSKVVYIGDKLTITMDYEICKLLSAVFHTEAVNDSKIFAEILNEAKKE